MAFNEEERWTRTTQLIPARIDEVFAAFLNPELLVRWLPPNDMTGVFHEFDARAGGGYRMSLHYAKGDSTNVGKSAELEDQVIVRFDAIEPPHRIVESVTFVTDDVAMQGTMIQTITLEKKEGGTLATLFFENLPPALKAADNDEGASISLGQLAALFEK